MYFYLCTAGYSGSIPYSLSNLIKYRLLARQTISYVLLSVYRRVQWEYALLLI